MPGLVGLVTKLPRAWAESQLTRMVEAIHHESFYNVGTWTETSQGLYVGWAIRNGGFVEQLPLRNGRGDVAMAFSGEEYSGRDASSLVRQYEDDRTFPAGLNGRFQGVLSDASRGTALLFNDRWGMHRIYVHEAAEATYFAAEAKAILAVRPELRQLNERALGEFVSCGCVLGNRTLFSGIEVLPPASAWTLRAGAVVAKQHYFDPREWEEQDTLEPEAYYLRLRETFSRTLPRYFGGRQRQAMSLTGGLDSRMLLAWKRLEPGALPCYSFGDASRDCEDVSLARTVAAACGQPHEVIPVGDAFLSRFAHYAERSMYLSDGCTGVDRAADLYLNERARTIAPVRLTGNYGGEVLRRVRAFKPGKPQPGLFADGLLRDIQQAEETYRDLVKGHPLSFAVFRQAPWHHFGLLALEETQLSMRSPFLDNEFVKTVFQAPASACQSSDVSLRLIEDGDPKLTRIRTDRGLAGASRGWLAAAQRRCLDFTFKAEYAYDSGMPQWLAGVDHVLSPLRLERLFLGRHKFAHFRVWYRDQLANYVKDVLLDSRSLQRGYVNRKAIEETVTGHLKGNRNHTDAIHQMLTLELTHRLFFDSVQAADASRASCA